MNQLTLIHANLRSRPLAAVFNILLLAMGIATILTLTHLDRQISTRMSQDLKGIDLVISGKGSPLQIILSTVFHLDIPTGNIPLAEALEIERNPLVKSAIPMALGDNFNGYRIVGTTSAYITHYKAQIAQGQFYKKPMEVVVGSDVARTAKLNIGDKILSAHGLTGSSDIHTDSPYTVAGILAPTSTVIDRVVLTPVESIWHVHDHEEEEGEEAHHGPELTALLISYKSPLAAAQLPRLINSKSSMQAASPAFEMARLTKLLGTGSDLISAFGILLIAFAGFGFFVTLSNAINDRLHDIALLRSLGATRQRVFLLILSESLVLGILGSGLGFLLSLSFQKIVSLYIAMTKHITLPPTGFEQMDYMVIIAGLALSLAAAILPAIKAYRLDIPKTLAHS